MAVYPITGSQATQSRRLDSQQVQANDKTGQQAQQAELTASNAELKARANQNIVQAMFGKTGQGDDKAMNILYSEIMSTINAELGEEHAITPEKMAGQTDDYWSPEKTAGRIVEGALGFFETFQKQNPNMAEDEQVAQFLSTITKAIDKGYGEATRVLDGLKVFDGSIKDNAEATRSLIDEKLAAFREARLGSESSNNSEI